MRIEVLHPSELTERHVADWRRLQACDPDLRSPFFTPDWARLIGTLRPDARVAIVRNGAETVGFYAVQRPNAFAALPLGAPLADYHGVIAAPGTRIDMRRVALALRVDRLDFSYAPISQTSLRRAIKMTDGSWTCDLGGGFAAYAARRAAAGSDVLKKVGQRRRKLERERGPVTIDAFTKDAAVFDTMLAWKRAQLHETRQPDLFAHPWIERALRAALACDGPAFQASQVCVRVDGAPIAVMLALCAGATLHGWFTAYDPAFAAYSPGMLAHVETLRAAADAGFTEADFGTGAYVIKEQIATGQRRVGQGFVGRVGMSAVVREAQYQLRLWAEGREDFEWRDLPGKAMRRIDYFRGVRAPDGASAA